MTRVHGVLFFLLWLASVSLAAEPKQPLPADRALAAYFAEQTAKLQNQCLADLTTVEEWKSRRPKLLAQLREMLGLDPWPEKTDLKATVTRRLEQEDFVVENLHFQSRPGLYVTGNLYLPKKIDQPCPAILYLCGHGAVKENGVSYGNKVYYQHHGEWFARHGYVCLTIDSLQLGEIEGLHHGTYNLNQWWWVNRGYTPAGVEAWNCIRALDYLQTRKEVDPERLGATGRSGGGAYSWWIAALDERIKVAVPVAGITDLENHVVDGCVDGHCDCMYFLNTYRWDYPQVAALVAPRPLLISNTDRDGIFPLEGVVRTHAKTRDVYRLLGAAPNLALQITAGGHADTQELHIHAFRWFDQHLLKTDRLIEKPAVKLLDREQLRVFQELPKDAINRDIAETFVAAAPSPTVPASKEAWAAERDRLLAGLREKCFAAWPKELPAVQIKQAWSAEREGIRLAAYDFASEANVPLRLYVAERTRLERPELAVVNIMGGKKWQELLANYRPAFEKELAGDLGPLDKLPPASEEGFKSLQGMFAKFKWAMAYLSPRGTGREAWSGDAKRQNQLARRFYLLGSTVDGQRVLDIVQGVAAARAAPELKETPIWLQSEEPELSGVTLYASLFGPPVKRLDLYGLPMTHKSGPYLLSVNRVLDMPQTLALAAERSQVILYGEDEPAWQHAKDAAKILELGDKRVQVRKPPTKE